MAVGQHRGGVHALASQVIVCPLEDLLGVGKLLLQLSVVYWSVSGCGWPRLLAPFTAV